MGTHSGEPTGDRQQDRRWVTWIAALALGTVGGILTFDLMEPVGRAFDVCNSFLGCLLALPAIALVMGLVDGLLVPGWRQAIGVAIGLCVGAGIASALTPAIGPYESSPITNFGLAASLVATVGVVPALVGFAITSTIRRGPGE
jgi:hypothetical protein